MSEQNLNPFFSDNIIQELTDLRRYLHAHPEVSSAEFQTARHLRGCLENYSNVSEVIDLDETGFAVSIKGSEPGQRIMLRCELDALPIQETNDFDHRSAIDGVSHKCGHDGHMATMMGVLRWIDQHPPKNGEVVLLFQSAEETGDGAVGAYTSENFHKIEPDFIYALHNVPGTELNTVMLRDGAFTPSVKSLIFEFEGKTSHAAEPEKGVNPAAIIADCLHLGAAICHNEPNDEDFFLVTPVHVNMGEMAYGISAGYGEVHLTIRSWDEKLFHEKCTKFIADIEKLGEGYGIQVSHEWCFEFKANMNDPEVVTMIEAAAKEASLHIERMDAPFKFGEDFGHFTQHFKGAMFGLGAGVDCPALHNPDYDFPDELIPVGATLFINILKSHLRFV